MKIQIEQRGDEEVKKVLGADKDGKIRTVRIAPEESPAANYAFDVTPAKYISGIITDKGIISADKISLKKAKTI